MLVATSNRAVTIANLSAQRRRFTKERASTTPSAYGHDAVVHASEPPSTIAQKTVKLQVRENLSAFFPSVPKSKANRHTMPAHSSRSSSPDRTPNQSAATTPAAMPAN